MGLVAVLARAIVRGHRWALLGLAALIAIGIGTSLTAMAIATRTDRAYGDYVASAEVAELVVNPSLSSARAAEIISAAPGVRRVVTDDLFAATLDDGEPRSQTAVDSSTVQLRMSSDGRYSTQDRPAITHGRMVGHGAEAFISEEVAEAMGLDVGDGLDVSFWRNSYNTPGIGAAPDEIVEPLGSARVEVVGIGVFPDEVLVDDLYPRQRVLVSEEVAAPYTCVLGDLTTLDIARIEDLAAAIPADCALSYRYFSIRVNGGEANAIAVAESISAAFDRENLEIPAIVLEHDVRYTLIPTFANDQRVAVDRATGPGVTALRIFGITAAAATVALAVIATIRVARRWRVDANVWRQLGVDRPTRALALASAVSLGIVGGLIAALAAGWLGSSLGPVGSVGRLAPGISFDLPLDVTVVVLAPVAVILLATTLWVAARHRTVDVARVSVGVSPLIRMSGSMSPAGRLGMRAAAHGPVAVAVMLGGVIAIAVVSAGAVFASNVSDLVDRPDRYGWPYDAAVLIGFGYGGGNDDVIESALDRPDVDRFALNAMPTISVDGVTLAAIAAREGYDSWDTPVRDGRLPSGADEIALGVETLTDLDLQLGDRVEVASFYGDRTATVVGVVVLPSVGAYGSIRADSGRGALLSAPMFADMLVDAEISNGLEPGSLSSTGMTSLVTVDLADGVDPAAFMDSLGSRLPWDLNGFESFAVTTPIQPSALHEAATMQRVPGLLSATLAAAMAIGLALGIATATRARRAELLTVRALGGSPRQLRASVRWHAAAVVAVAAIIGLPVGVIAGRLVARQFLDDLGVVPTVSTPWLTMIVIVAAAFAAGMIAAAGPARAATSRPGPTTAG